MFFLLPDIFIWIGAVIGWVAYWRVMRRQNEIRQVSPEYAAQLFRTSSVSAFIFKGYLRITSLLFISPPAQLEGMMRPMRKIMAASLLVSLLGFSLLWMTTR